MRRMVITVIIIIIIYFIPPMSLQEYYHGDLQLLDQYIYFGVSITRGAPSSREF